MTSAAAIRTGKAKRIARLVIESLQMTTAADIGPVSLYVSRAGYKCDRGDLYFSGVTPADLGAVFGIIDLDALADKIEEMEQHYAEGKIYLCEQDMWPRDDVLGLGAE